MSIGLIPSRYAKALLDFANENYSAETVYEEAKLIVKVLTQVKEANQAIRNPKLPIAQKKQLMKKILGVELSESLQTFIDLLLKNKRETLFLQILLKYIDLYREDNKINHTQLTIASPIDTATKERFVKFIESQTGGTVELDVQVNPDILGGFQIEVNHLRWDATLSKQLEKMKEKMLNGNTN